MHRKRKRTYSYMRKQLVVSMNCDTIGWCVGGKQASVAKQWLECLESRNYQPLIAGAGESSSSSSSFVDSLVLNVWCGGSELELLLHDFYSRVLDHLLDGTATATATATTRE